jgi:hypothetical protein
MPLNFCGIGHPGQSLLQQFDASFGLPLLHQSPAQSIHDRGVVRLELERLFGKPERALVLEFGQC